MARLAITDYVQLGSLNGIKSTNWYVYIIDPNTGKPDKSFTLFESLNDSVNKFKIIATLKNKDGTLFDINTKPAIAFVSFNVDGNKGKEFQLPLCKLNDKETLPQPLPYKGRVK